MQCKKNGCRAYAMKDDPDGLCFWHSDRTKDRRRKAGKRGGSRGKMPVQDVDIQTVDDVRQILSQAISELLSASSESITAKSRAVGYLCSVALVAIEKGSLEDRIAKLEELLSQKTA